MSTIIENPPSTSVAQPAIISPHSEGSYVPLSTLRRGATVWGMVGVSESLRKLQDRIRAAAASELSVLIIGETGSGKELVANAIHQESKRSQHRFVAVNTGAIPRELVSSELFGHVKGSFTGATKDREGRFVEADGGTLFLDELGTMDARTQIGLLRALEQRVIQPVGLSKDIPVNVRIVAATNCNLLNEVKSGNFREDLYYRLESFVIPVPPLRQRREDIPMLAAFFAEKVAQEDGRQMMGFTSQALQDLCSYDWPGNIRELRNAVAQSVILSSNGVIDWTHLPEKIANARKMKESAASTGAVAGNCGISGLGATSSQPPVVTSTPVVTRRGDIRNAPGSLGGAQISLLLDSGLDAMVVQIMQKTLEICNGNVTRAAQVLGISRKTIYNRLRTEGLGKERLLGAHEVESRLNTPPPPAESISSIDPPTPLVLPAIPAEAASSAASSASAVKT